MTGRAAPSDLELRENLHKRMYIPPGGRKPLGGKREEEFEKRFNREGTKPLSASSGNQANSLSSVNSNSLDDTTLTFGDIIDALTSLANGASGNDLIRNRHKSKPRIHL